MNFEIFDLFNVPFKEYWDWRGAFYGDVPIGSTCFSFEGIPGGASSPNPAGTGACDVPPTGYSGETWATYPYMDWIPWYADSKDTFVYAPYKMRVTGVDQPGSTLDQPVILPVFNPSAAAGSNLHVRWDYRYLVSTEVPAVDIECGSNIQFSYDGFVSENTITVTMDEAESRRVFGVTGDPATFWSTAIDPSCNVKTTFERSWESFMAEQGGKSPLTSGIGPYDIASGWEWYYQPFATNFLSATRDPATGLWTIVIQHWAWGTEALLARWFYWGTSKYFDAGPDGIVGSADDVPNAEIYPHNKAGWWEWEVVWFEDLVFDTMIGSASQDFTFEAVSQYHMQAGANAGPDGVLHTATLASTDDFAVWQWQPILADYIYGGTASFLQRHVISALDPYQGLTFLHSNPGSPYFGAQYRYDLTPAEWDLGAGDRITFRLPTEFVKFIDPYSPLTAVATDLRTFNAEIGFGMSTPSLPAANSEVTDSNGDGILDTVTLFGPLDWNAPDMPLAGFPALEFSAQVPPPPPFARADLVGRSAWPDFHHLDKSARGSTQTLFALVGNLGNVHVSVEVTWEVQDAAGALVATRTASGVVGLGLKLPLSATLDVTDLEGRFVVTAWVMYDSDGDGSVDTQGVKLKRFSFAVVP